MDNFDLNQFLNKGMREYFEQHNLLSPSKYIEKMKLMEILFTAYRNVLPEIQSKILSCTKKKHFPVKMCIVLLD